MGDVEHFVLRCWKVGEKMLVRQMEEIIHSFEEHCNEEKVVASY